MKRMRIDGRPKQWYFVFIVVLLLIPLLHFFSSGATPKKTGAIAADADFLAGSYSLSNDINHLIYCARAYMVRPDNDYWEEFDAYSTTVTKNELNLYNKAAPGEERKELENLINLTREYIFFMQDKVAAAETADPASDLGIYREQHDVLATRLQEAVGDVPLARYENLQREAGSLETLGQGIGIASSVLLVLVLISLFVGTRKFIYPALVRSGYTEDITGSARFAVLIIDQRGKIAKVNPAAERLFGLRAGEIMDRPLNDITAEHPPLLTLTQPLLDVLVKQKRVADYQVLYADRGQKTSINADYFPLYYADKLTGAAMTAYSAEISRNNRDLFDAIESERKKISIEIHDWIGRSMSPIIHSLDYVMRAAEGKIPDPVYDDLVRLRGHCQTAAIDMRGIMNDIHPYLIDKVGLVSALESYTIYFEEMHGIAVYMYYQNRDFKLDKRTQIIVYRIIQETLVNASKHSNASEVDIYFKEEGNTLKIEIIDNGEAPQQFKEGTGLWGMKERANLIGGDLVYGSTESGFSIILTVPLAAAAGDVSDG